MRKFTHFLAIGAISTYLGTGCAPLYIPPPAMVPELEQRGDVSGTLHVGNQGVSGNVVYAYSDRLFIAGSIASLSARDRVWTGQAERDHRYGEFAAGWYLPPADNFTMLLAWGAGTGDAFAAYQQTFGPIRHRGLYNRYFFQVNGALTGEHGSMGLAMRYAQVYMDYTDLAMGTDPEHRNQDFLEVVIYRKIGFPNFKVHAQLGSTAHFGKSIEVPYRMFITSLGFVINFSTARAQK